MDEFFGWYNVSVNCILEIVVLTAKLEKMSNWLYCIASERMQKLKV